MKKWDRHSIKRSFGCPGYYFLNLTHNSYLAHTSAPKRPKAIIISVVLLVG